MRRANAISGFVLAAIAILALLVVIPWQIENGPAGMMSPRLVPQLMMGAVLVLSVLLVLTNLEPAGRDDPPPFSREELRALALISGVFAVSITLYLTIGALAFGSVLVAGTLVVLGERRPLIVAGMPVALMLLLWVLFYKILGTAIL
ncbi:Tripartite tricarboxylate transporter TctB family protein [Lutimaribacter pacificus]|uniref:Tripartite tricarboxylate transporter TctB family protein n=1 Tax=Lutimaribacter pacificus TaxID=391948 RepID=A0A1H0N7E5_9RHOB|nr:tripartite tricarboxylate transporter TctB family protein [Lutimaribacter pacificus]SDO88551.1 Tripartite tricarboxylate transporter TctB family protein [Lutimaribacter pacificus]SHK86244.1 Tripartite tricarboxylate transporter TctB family protein [Lutimaribacter pacificus]